MTLGQMAIGQMVFSWNGIRQMAGHQKAWFEKTTQCAFIWNKIIEVLANDLIAKDFKAFYVFFDPEMGDRNFKITEIL